MPQRRRIDRLEAALAAAETTIVDRIRTEANRLGDRWLAELKTVIGSSSLLTREGLDVEMAQLDVRFALVFEQLNELKNADEPEVANMMIAALRALQAKTAGLFGACSARIEAVEEAVGEAGRRLQEVEATLAHQAAEIR
jgi:hypothetical protein